MGIFSHREGKSEERKPAPDASKPAFRRVYMRNSTRAGAQGFPIEAAKPFLEHPNGDHERARDAIRATYERLCALPVWTEPIRLTAQGQGSRLDSYQFRSVEMTPTTLRPLALIDLEAALEDAGLTQPWARVLGHTIEFVGLTSVEVARLVDAVFRRSGIRDLEDDPDYAFGAEWLAGFPDFPVHGHCIAMNRLMEPGQRVGYMYREDSDREGDSGWRFFVGDESDDEANDPDRLSIYNLTTLVTRDPSLLPYLDADWGSAFERGADGRLVRIED